MRDGTRRQQWGRFAWTGTWAMGFLVVACVGVAPEPEPGEEEFREPPPQVVVPVENPQGVDAGGEDAGEVDAGHPGPDAGGVDAGTGTGAKDAGVTVPDAGTPLRIETVFSRRPANNASDETIERRIIALINAARPGSRMRVAMYTFTRRGPADALIAARARGVDVRLVMDGDSDTTNGSEVSRLISGLGASRVYLCTAPGASCTGTNIMHNKFFLFSELNDGTKNVVVQASHNLTNAQLSLHNNAVIISGDKALYAAYEQTWADLRADVENPDYYRTEDGDGPFRAYFFPRKSGDTVVGILQNVSCDSTATVRAAIAYFTNARQEVADALVALKAQGCKVEVVAGDDDIPVGDDVENTLRQGGVTLVKYPSRTGGWSLHSKYLLIDADYAGSTSHRRLVFTGSHNWTGPSLTSNDETLLRIDDGAVFSAFTADWLHIKASAVIP